MLDPNESLQLFEKNFIEAFKLELSHQVNADAKRVTPPPSSNTHRNLQVLSLVSNIADATSVPGAAIPSLLLEKLISACDAKKQDKKAPLEKRILPICLNLKS
jgi:hypothetical protein